MEICAGAGGQALGLQLAGFQHELAVEIDKDAAATLTANIGGDVVRLGDVTDPAVWCPSDYEGVDLFAGGVPCPPFSLAGKQLGADDERDLLAWAIETVGEVRPKAVMIENVRGLSMPKFAEYRQAVRSRLMEFGYWPEWRMLSASDYGVSQLRPRFILVAMRWDYAPYFEWPAIQKPAPTVGECIGDLMGARGWCGADRWVAQASGIAPTIVGGSKKHGGADLGPTRAKRAWLALGVDGKGIANEAPGPDEPVDFVPRLTCEMAARLQGWLDAPEYRWKILGRKTSTYRQIGNAFPPPVARAVGESIHRALSHAG